MAAGVHNFKCEQGATFSRVLTLTDDNGDLVSLVGYAARMQVRERVKSDSYLIELTTENGRISLGGAAGTITLTLTAAETAALTNDGVYDLELIAPDTTVTRILEGRFNLSPEVTR